MAYEVISAADLGNLDAGELLHHLDTHIRASKVIEAGAPDGLIRTLDFSPEGEEPDGIASYSPGIDQPWDLAIVETFANERPLAKKNMGAEEPHKLHTLIEWGQRYDGATGNQSLAVLARMTLALTCIVAERAGSEMQAVVALPGQEPLVIDEKPFDAVWTVSQYDEEITKVAKDKYKRPDRSADPLTEGLRYLVESGHGPYADSDTCLVVSDFLGGVQRNQVGKFQGFNWQSSLEGLNQELDDRLFVVQLTSPAQQNLPLVHSLQGDRTIEQDTYEQLIAADKYRQMALEKASRIAGVLRGIRQVQLSSTSEAPFVDLSDFVFGKPVNA